MSEVDRKHPLDTVAGLPGFVGAWQVAGPFDTWEQAAEAATASGDARRWPGSTAGSSD